MDPIGLDVGSRGDRFGPHPQGRHGARSNWLIRAGTIARKWTFAYRAIRKQGEKPGRECRTARTRILPRGEEDVPTQEEEARQDSRFSGSHENQGRSSDP